MAEALSAALAAEGLGWLVFAAFVAGLVRGFAGFGTAMIYMPVAASVLPPVWALTTMMAFDVIGPLPNVPRALRDGRRRDIFLLGLGALIALPLGVFVLTRLPVAPFRWAVSAISLFLLVLLILGWRYRGVLSRRMILAVGGMGGALAGSTGLAGPPVIMLYMAGRSASREIRANITLYLLLTDVLMLGVFALNGILEAVPVTIGLLLAPVYLLGNVVGGRLYRPDAERLYRVIAYVIIAVSALSALPLFD